ncbi:glycosyltransferase family 4 protein [Spongisporangium articulatum]|uniref:Glycosyltransferase family 4 protein n=1 Tax=Spongisporangium articulatum TaxID=3362603 RepID=A0ABW8AHK5_9ACTN
MRVGLIAPPWIPVPPTAYGGTEAVVDHLARGLAAAGHDVQLFTVGDSTCPVPRLHLHEHGAEPMGDSAAEAAHVLEAYEALADVDIIHDHTVLGPMLALRACPNLPPVVVTNHNPFNPTNTRIFTEIARTADVVAISKSHARSAVDVPITDIVHHGIDLDVYRPGPAATAGSGDYLMFMGRMCADKGVHTAVRVARETGHRLVIATKMREASERQYFSDCVSPLLGPDDVLHVEAPLDVRLDLLHRARALVNPIAWREPFGLVMAEALATGTPVLASPLGAAPEIVDHGVTGFLCHDGGAMIAAVGRLEAISRADCRAAAVERFSMERMARDYADLYRRILDSRPKRAIGLSVRTVVQAAR